MEAVGLAPELAAPVPVRALRRSEAPRCHRGRDRHASGRLLSDEPTAGLRSGRPRRSSSLSAITMRSPARPSSSSRTPWRIFRRSLTVCSSWITQEFCSAIRRARVFLHADEIVAAGLDIPMITKVMIELKKRGHDVDTGLYRCAGDGRPARLQERKGALTDAQGHYHRSSSFPETVPFTGLTRASRSC